jgi:hypothetical protein
MKRVIRRVVTVVTTETWLVDEDEHEEPRLITSLPAPPRIELAEGEESGHLPTTHDSTPREGETPRNAE